MCALKPHAPSAPHLRRMHHAHLCATHAMGRTHRARAPCAPQCQRSARTPPGPVRASRVVHPARAACARSARAPQCHLDLALALDALR